jgi:hypothetical protein
LDVCDRLLNNRIAETIKIDGNVIVEKGTMQFALGYDIAEKILVECL